MASTAECSTTGARQVSQTPAQPNEDPWCHAQPAASTHKPAEAALIYFNNIAKIHPPPLKKNAGKN